MFKDILSRKYLYRRQDNIVLHQYRAIYFPIPKVASTSIKRVIADVLNIPHQAPNNPNSHLHQREYPFVKKERILRDYGDYYKFCFVRNPWDRLVSCYNNKISIDSELTNPFFRKGVSTAFVKYGKRFWGGMSFHDFVHVISNIPDSQADSHFKSQYKFITDKRNNLLVDFIGKFENLDNDYKFVFNKIGLKDTQLPHLLKKDHKNYMSYYNDNDIRKLVEKRYSIDIELLSYKT